MVLNLNPIQQMAANVGICFPTKLPEVSTAPDPQAMAVWVKHHDQTPLMQTIAKKIVQHINHVSTECFLEKLQETIADFHASCNRSYVLCVCHDSARVSCKSDQWVAGLALERCNLRFPNAIVKSQDLDACLRAHPEIHDILILDDAAYSGAHLTDGLAWMKTGGCHIYIGIPFMTNKAKKRVEEKCAPDLAITVLKHSHLPVLEEMLTQDEKYHFVVDMDMSREMTRTLTYFDHKFPDSWSTLQNIATGNHLLRFHESYYMERRGCVMERSEQDALYAQLFQSSAPIVGEIHPPYYPAERSPIKKMAENFSEDTPLVKELRSKLKSNVEQKFSRQEIQQRIGIRSFSFFQPLPTAEKTALGGLLASVAVGFAIDWARKYTASEDREVVSPAYYLPLLAVGKYVFDKFRQDAAVEGFYRESRGASGIAHRYICDNSKNVQKLGGKDTLHNACALRIFSE